MIRKLLVHSLLLSSATLPLHAYALEIIGSKEAKTLSPVARPGLRANQETSVYLMKIKLNKNEVAALKKNTTSI